MDPFGSGHEEYLRYRPAYPREFVLELIAYVGDATCKSCLDIGCGTGQLTRVLGEYFKRVVGVDRSEAQLAHAIVHGNVEYQRVENASDLSTFPSEEFNCVTIAQALHWLPLEKSLAEFYRVLKPNGVFAAMGYGVCHLKSKERTYVPVELAIVRN